MHTRYILHTTHVDTHSTCYICTHIAFHTCAHARTRTLKAPVRTYAPQALPRTHWALPAPRAAQPTRVEGSFPGASGSLTRARPTGGEQCRAGRCCGLITFPPSSDSTELGLSRGWAGVPACEPGQLPHAPVPLAPRGEGDVSVGHRPPPRPPQTLGFSHLVPSLPFLQTCLLTL